MTSRAIDLYKSQQLFELSNLQNHKQYHSLFVSSNQKKMAWLNVKGASKYMKN
jgi:hypothetical protein